MTFNRWLRRFFIFCFLVIHEVQATAEQDESFYKPVFFHALETKKGSSAARVEVLSETLLGARYAGGTLGEGEQGLYDKDPLTRFNEFDCTTFIETVLAGAMSSSSEDFLKNLISLRYQNSHVSYVTRNHFPSLDWVPNNLDKLDDISPWVAGDAVETAQAIIDKAAWYHKTGERLLACNGEGACQELLAAFHNAGDAFKPEEAKLDYVPLTALYPKEGEVNQGLLDRIPSGSVVNIVRPDWALKAFIGTNMNVSHQGIAIRKNGQLFLRHASVKQKKVIDEDFLAYFARYIESPSLKGFNVLVLK